MKNNNKQEIFFNIKNIIIYTLVVLGVISVFAVFLKIWQIILILFFSFILYSSLGPIVDFAVKKKFPKGLAITLVFTFLIVFIIVLLGLATQPIIEQIKKLIENLPKIVTSIFQFLINTFPSLKENINPQDIGNLLSTYLSSINIGSILSSLGNFFSDLMSIIFNMIMIFVLTSFLLSERGTETKEKIIIKNLLGNRSARFFHVYMEVQTKLGAWLRGQLFICGLTGVVNFLIFGIFNFEFALAVSLLAAFLEAIPNIGPTLLMPIGALIALGSGGDPILVLIYAIIMGVFQQFQNVYIIPLVMKRSVGLNPIITLTAVLVGTSLGGIMGAIMAIPIIAVIQIIIEDILQTKNIIQRSD